MQPVAFSSSYFSATKQRYTQIKAGKLAIWHAYRKFDQLLLKKSGITVNSDHKPLENIFKHSKDSASRHLQSILFSAVHSLFNIAGIFRPHCWHPFSCTTSRNSIGTSPRGIGIPPGEVTPVYRPYIYLPRNRVRFLRFSVLKKSIFLPCFSCVPGVVLKPGS